ncbi:TIGR00282 family metallophosphoesterase [Fimbriiglobus ruber]|uniref:Phosphoesterase n=1 Tax=Fimbriiglobus ruber TaxID=1908690 RepID=A0A225E0Y0_9BACT|nr:TIGR00282 family metallophosphoesterase [Fimbriiglobus ruber]OWK46823.1 Phosphoesterase [Fimbriiglobus ruber]
MRILFIGDIVGTSGVGFVRKAVPLLRASEKLDLVVANAENATNGAGLSPKDYRLIRAAGVDAVTLGDHIYKKFDIADVLNNPAEPVCKPANFPPTAAGRDHVVVTAANGADVAVVSLMGRTFMKPVDCPFAAADRVLAGLAGRAKVIVVDVHAEATADKYLLAHHLNGRVSAVFGTHTHVQTADEQILAGGTAFVCDVGMTGPYESVLGRRVDRVLRTATTFEPTPFDVATNDVRLGGAIVDVDPDTGKATAIRRVMLRENEL